MSRKLLLADDSVTIQRVIKLTFADEDVEVVTVGDGNQAVASIDQQPPDIVLADVAMPGRTGYEVAQHIRTSPRLAHIPVLLLTGVAMVLSARHLLLARAHDALSEELREISTELDIDGDEAAFRSAANARFFYHNIYEFAIFATDGRPVFRSVGLQTATPEELHAADYDQQVQLRKCRLRDGREMLVSGWIKASSFGPLVVTAATSTEPFDRELLTLESTVAMILPISLGCSLLCGYWLAGRVLRPVRVLAEAARALSIDRLDQRIVVENAHDEIGQLTETLNLLLSRLETAVQEIRQIGRAHV